MRKVMLAAIVGGLILFATLTSTKAKYITHYGHDPSFWRTHTLIIGKVDHLEHRHRNVYHTDPKNSWPILACCLLMVMINE